VKKEIITAGAKRLRQVLETAGTGGKVHELAKREFLLFPHKVLSNTNSSHRRGAAVLVNLKRLQEGRLLDPKPLSEAKRKAIDCRIGRQVHKQLRNGNVTRAARAMEQTEVAELSEATRAKLLVGTLGTTPVT
jgi:hypothetical protein